MPVHHDPAKTAPHVMEEKSIPSWQKWLAVTVAVGLFVVIFIWPSRVLADFWPIDQGVAANVLASLVQYAIILVVLALLWPPTRRRFHGMVDAKLTPIHEHLTVLRQHHEHAERHRDKTDAAIAEIHAQLGIEDKPETVFTASPAKKPAPRKTVAKKAVAPKGAK